MENQAIRPSEAARRLGVAPNTLRVYSSRFSSLLSSTAGAPRASRSGGAAHRLYSPSDLEILDEAKGLLSTGLTYEQALSKLTARIVGKEDAVARRRSGQFSRENPDLPDLRTLQDALDAWRSLAEERGREVAELRAF